jgi:hypothetical protein
MITLYRDTIINAAKDTDNTGEERQQDAEIVDAEIDSYLDYLFRKLSDELGGDDQVLVADGSGWGPCCHTMTTREQEAWFDLDDFWCWWNS